MWCDVWGEKKNTEEQMKYKMWIRITLSDTEHPILKWGNGHTERWQVNLVGVNMIASNLCTHWKILSLGLIHRWLDIDKINRDTVRQESFTYCVPSCRFRYVSPRVHMCVCVCAVHTVRQLALISTIPEIIQWKSVDCHIGYQVSLCYSLPLSPTLS